MVSWSCDWGRDNHVVLEDGIGTMKVHRFIGLSELEAIAEKGKVEPLKEGGCLYFFSEDDVFHESPEYELEYCSGIVGDMKIDGVSRLFCMIELNLPRKRLVKEIRTYADPEGSFWDTIGVEEYHLYGAYAAADIRRVVLFADDWTATEIAEFKAIDEAYGYLKARNVRDFSWSSEFSEFKA